MGASGRNIVGYLGRKLGGYLLSRIADHFRRHPVSLCQGIAKVERRLREEDGFREKLRELEKNPQIPRGQQVEEKREIKARLPRLLFQQP